MDFVERYKDRKVLSPEITFKHGPFTFRVARFSEVERENARIKARARLRSEGIDPQTAETIEQNVAFFVVYAEFVARHIKGWTHHDVTPIEFSKKVFDELFAEMDDAERLGFSAAYLTACAADEAEKKRPSHVNGQASSAQNSNTSLNAPSNNAPDVSN